MKFLRLIITTVYFVTSFNAIAGEQAITKVKCVVNQPTHAEWQRLQGTWEGAQVGDMARRKITITITGDALHFYRDANFWFETTIILPAGKDPKQLHATIKDCPPSEAAGIGKVVKAFFKIEDETLTLATIGEDAEETWESFETAGTRYELRKVQPQKKSTQPPKTKRNGNA